MGSDKPDNRKPGKLTERDLKILQKLSAAGWLTTRQILNYFFLGKTTRAVCKRLQRLVTGGYIAKARTSSTESALYRLARRGKPALIEYTALDEGDITIPKQLPRKIEHFTAINDLRFHFEQLSSGDNVQLRFFFSERELYAYRQDPSTTSDGLLTLLSKYAIVPDAIAKIRITCEGMARDVTLAIEYDAGTEHAGFFGRTKIKQYASLFEQNAEWLGDFKVLTFAYSVRRIVSLMRQTVRHQPPAHLFYFAGMEKLHQKGWVTKEVFLDPYDFFIPIRRAGRVEPIEKEARTGIIPKYALAALAPACSRKGFSRENHEILDKTLRCASLPAKELDALYK